MPTQKGLAPIVGIISIVVILIVGFILYQVIQTSTFPLTLPRNQIACTQDAKLCPDGSAVGRTGPKCEFSLCPTSKSTSSDETANWKTYTNTEYNFSFNYPQNLLSHERKYPDTQAPYRFMVLLLGQQLTNEELEGILTHEWGDFYIGIDSKLHTEQDLKRVVIDDGKITEDGTILNKYKYEQITINELAASKKTSLSRTELDEDKRTRIKFNKGGYGWTIHYPNTDFEGNHNPVYDQILSTFRFLD